MSTALAIVLFLVGGISTVVWFRATAAKYTSTQRQAFVILAIACWISLYILANTQLSPN